MRKQLTTLLITLCCGIATATNIVWFDGTRPISYQVVGKTDPVVKMALQMWSDDMEQVTGMLQPLSSNRVKALMTVSVSVPRMDRS